MPKRRTRAAAASGFVYKTFELLKDTNVAEIVAWDESGATFEVKDVTAFSTEVLPKYFKHANFTSFVRQLNMYDFRKEPGRYAFSHPLFTKDAQHRLRKMRRKATDPDRVERETNTGLQEILQKIYSLQRSQNQLQLQIASLQGSNKSFKEANLQLEEEIAKFKERCRRMDQVARLFIECAKQPGTRVNPVLPPLESLPCQRPFPLLALPSDVGTVMTTIYGEESGIVEDGVSVQV